MKDMAQKHRAAKGHKNGTHTHPGKVARGKNHGSFTHPERVSKGENHVSAVLTNDAVVEIRALYAAGRTTHLSLAKKYGVGSKAIGKVIRRETWKHI